MHIIYVEFTYLLKLYSAYMIELTGLAVLHTVLEIAAGHWPFSDQFYHLADHYPFWLAKFTVHFQWDSNQYPTKCLIFKKWPTNF